MSAPEPPSTVGPFRVGRPEYESEAGTVLAGETPDGRAVDVVRLGLGPSCDPAARDRFRACIASLEAESPGAVLGADPDSPWPWVALAPGAPGGDARFGPGGDARFGPSGDARFGPSGDARFGPAGDASGDPGAGTATEAAGGAVGRLLAAAVPPGSQTVPPHGPQFSPYWRGRRPPALAGAPAVAGRGWGWERWALVALVVLVLLLLLLWWLLTRPLAEGPEPAPSPAPTVSQLPPPLPGPSPGPPSSVPSGGGSEAPVVRFAPAAVQPPPPR